MSFQECVTFDPPKPGLEGKTEKVVLGLNITNTKGITIYFHDRGEVIPLTRRGSGAYAREYKLDPAKDDYLQLALLMKRTKWEYLNTKDHKKAVALSSNIIKL